jgi:FAD synthase
LIGHTGEIYDRALRLHLLRRLRGLVRFDGIEALKAQISLDVQATSDAAAASDPFVEP